MHHNDIVSLGLACDCPCHRGARDECWCRTNKPSPHNIEHNTQVEIFGACRCGCHRRQRDCRCRHTDPQFLAAIDQHRQRQEERDLMMGKPHAITRAIKRGDPRILRMLGNQRR